MLDLDPVVASTPLKPVVTEEKLNLLWPQPQSIVQGGGRAFVIKDNLEVLILASPGQGVHLGLVPLWCCDAPLWCRGACTDACMSVCVCVRVCVCVHACVWRQDGVARMCLGIDFIVVILSSFQRILHVEVCFRMIFFLTWAY